MTIDLLVLGCGYTGSAVARLARSRGLSVLATVRTAARATPLRVEGFDVRITEALEPRDVEGLVSPKTQVVVAFPPDGQTDERLAPVCADAAAITYVSSTGVYGDLRGLIDDATPLPSVATERGARLLRAEQAWRACGATVLRCPAIYGRDRGLHVRIVSGAHRIPGDGTAFTSRIHVEDLAQLILAARNVRGETFVVGDRAPATQNEIADWVAKEYGVPRPPHVPVETVHETLRADRRIDGSRALAILGVTLIYPSYVDGMVKAPRVISG
ncbi:Nucleoside-diphosphate-sugar epimerase [Labilithrix luteola]|uniref:Nucleoside-diphosphate-sugar epimerase n=1 Tax=Labilithrix luteola TaxID=1391654 RepID=A0A0K1QAM1_9BACT|nr:NAD(P)H-binding protein [Labilithrix luteola]AKV02470.1 Nucleoside-diphosphate-sugar epimerase [Labilithrix luteola]